ncbi:copper chaperone [Cryptococcus deuterogattii 99/473]|uniref:Copper chaperone n=1 Tax=Cryptococcus deuterogattii Ram5 TaxID=1296110 RepID=A0A0D0T141_9TREE|nr:copper chaperone [Cryptococcus deuterogattii LA55]KIR34653.1 copper chaperone [Cryptococcus deuterogattii MMRL2647]KIR39412.1 copper chaperone [Cryptococcus deuterogattii Ram5]KIR73746.1 copper chaperone [Cryptococcus deuterogattii CA1014]KIR93238.1 copper chaperone [Cryptococcus deuterogattii CBS 10090]KIR99499.1 copper chaperone [Cryptococcus deuterogattii 2001/935-1]KIY59042.1 copper chaperone [Cryptococcus deuterogattii 99/473]
MTLATASFKCVNAVSGALRDVQVTIIGKTPPSRLLTALKSTNRQVIVRGTSSSANANFPIQAAVAIMESPLPLPVSLASTSNSVLAGLPGGSPKPLPGMNEEEHSQKVFGICRFVQIAPKTVLMDLTVRLPPPSRVGLGTAQGAQDTKYNGPSLQTRTAMAICSKRLMANYGSGLVEDAWCKRLAKRPPRLHSLWQRRLSRAPNKMKRQ